MGASSSQEEEEYGQVDLWNTADKTHNQYYEIV